MTTAPERMTKQNTERMEDDRAQQALPERRVKAQGHLSLVEWTEAVSPQVPEAHAPKIADAVRRTTTDKLFERGVFLLMATTVLAIVASFVHL